MLHPTLLVVAGLLAAAPPATDIEPVVETVHGREIVDDYRWLEALESESERVGAWTTEQNDFTRGVLDAIPGRAALEARLTELMEIGSVGLPEVRGGLHFYTERTGSQNQPVLYVRDGRDGAPRELLDVNGLDDRGLYALDWFVPSQDGRLVAFGISHAGDEMTVLHVLETATGAWLADEIAGKVGFAGWAPTNDGFLYGVLEDPSSAYSRAYKYHRIGRHHRMDPAVLRQSEPSRIPSAQLTRDGKWILAVEFEGWSKQDLFFTDARAWLAAADASTPAPELTPLAVGMDARFSFQLAHGDTVYIHTTHEAPNGALHAVDLTRPARDGWRLVLPERDDAVLGGVAETADGFVATYTKDVTTRLERFARDGRSLGEIPLPGLGRAAVATEHDRRDLFVQYTSFNEPTTIYHAGANGGELELWARPEVPVDPSLVVVKQEWCTSKDGTRVPMFIVHRKDLVPDGNTPTLVYGYGGFNASMLPRFGATDFPWLEHGGIHVTVNLRGGGEYGEAWHRAGMLESKQNVYDDLYAAAEHLIAEGYTSPEHMAVLGGSNGGLLTGVAAMQRPDLWAAVVSAVPLLDMVRFPDFLMARFWTPEYGDPADPEAFEWIIDYSPYHNIERGRKYPAILFTAGENDNRVHPMHARKMAAAMQARAANDHDDDPILLWVDREGGHGQGKPLHLRVRDVADRWSFVMWQTGMYFEE